MANNNLLSEFNPSDIAHFKKDFIQMIKVGAEIDRYYAEARQDLDVLIPKYEKLAEQMNRKYKGLKIKTKKTIDSYKVRIFVKSRDIKEFFAESASRIPGLKAVGKTGFGQVEVADAEKFAKFLDTFLDRIYMSYANSDSGTGTIIAEISHREKMVEIIYSAAEIISENSAGFRICAFYALRDGFNRKIEVYGNASTFGFFSLLDEIEKREWFDRFNPRYLE